MPPTVVKVAPQSLMIQPLNPNAFFKVALSAGNSHA